MQLEIEKYTAQLAESYKLKNALDQINVDSKHVSVQAGSLVATDRGTFFVAISLGKVQLANHSYLVISPDAPLGIKLIGLRKGDRVTFKDQTYMVLELE